MRKNHRAYSAAFMTTGLHTNRLHHLVLYSACPRHLREEIKIAPGFYKTRSLSSISTHSSPTQEYLQWSEIS
jgi:hypothetical protein